MSFKTPFDNYDFSSTPGKSRSFLSDVSTTPAGVPPTKPNPFAFGAPAPSGPGNSSRSLFNKSVDNDSIFGSSTASDPFMPPKRNPAPAKNLPPSQSQFSSTNGQGLGESTYSMQSNDWASSQMTEDFGPEDEVEEYEDEEDDVIENNAVNNPGSRFNFLESTISNQRPPTALGHRKSIYSNPADAKRPRLDERWASQSPLKKPTLPPKQDSVMPSIIRNFASSSRLAPVDEPSDVILHTGDEVFGMYEEARKSEEQGADFFVALSGVCDRLINVWKSCAERSGFAGIGFGTGRGDQAPNVVKAGILGSLLLQISHPPLIARGESPGPFGRLVLARPDEGSLMPMPKVLLDWLNANHASDSTDVQGLKEVEPSPSASPSFWETVTTVILRGRLAEASQILRSTDFNYARSALEDGLPQPGYRGAQLQNIQRCVNKALQILETCPGVQHENWDVKGAEWSLYRKQVLKAVMDLEEFAEGDEQAPKPPSFDNKFQAVNFGLMNTGNQGFSFTKSARMAESRVPWTIYQNLRTLYRLILGDPSAIMARSQDWIEAVVGLTAWWDGEDDEEIAVADDNLGSSMASFGRSRLIKSRGVRLVDENPVDAYLNRLELALSSATNDKSKKAFRINTMSGLEVGLASVFEGNVDGVVKLLQTWSLCIASAVVEVAAAGGWLEAGPGTMPGLNENDLMVLSYGQGGKDTASPISRDDVLSIYAAGLFERRTIEDESGERHGWELALEILSRLEDNEKMRKGVSDLLGKLPLDTAEQMDKVVLLCSELGLDNEGRRVSERYGDLTVEKSEEYGLALVCYARAHSRRKVKSVVDLLISYSLVQSHAYPASSDLDEQLRALIREPRTCLSAIAASDEEAASILQFYFSGYATLRRFYETRDEAVSLSEGQRPRHKPLARRRAAAQALVAVIRSAADSIYGGLYDPERDSAVQVDGLLTLLGEALVFINNESTPILTTAQQLTVLSAIEDLETVTARVYAQCEECFRSTLLGYHAPTTNTTAHSTSSILPPSPRTLLKKSVTSTTASSNFSLIGNDMLEAARTRSDSGTGSVGSSGVLVPRPSSSGAKLERGWDWRAGLGEDVKGEDVLRMLRLGLARGVSLGWS